MPKRPFQQMICLVGENPLPIYLGIADLCEQGARVWLVHSAETKKQAEAIQRKLGKRWTCPDKHLLLVDPFSPADVLGKLAPLMAQHPGAALNYTGGTKVMSAFAVQAHCSADPTDLRLDRLCYLEDRGHLFRFGDGEDQVVSDRTNLQVRDLIELHGGKIADADQWAPCTTADLKRMWDWFGGNALRELYDLARKTKGDGFSALSGQWDASASAWRHGSIWWQFLEMFTAGDLAHSWWRAAMPAKPKDFEDWNAGWYSEVALQWRLATGVWLELLAGYLARHALSGAAPTFNDARLDLGAEIVSGARIRLNQQPFETDLLLVRKNRLRLISATTKPKAMDVKQKMFEAKERARQIGGGQAFAAVVCPASRTELADCQATVDPSRNHRFFGNEDIQNWIDGKGLDELRDYLNK